MSFILAFITSLSLCIATERPVRGALPKLDEHTALLLEIHMASVNKVLLLGNLGRDPEVRYTPNGTAICNMSIATNETWKDAAGAKQERVEWHRIVCFGPVAENCGNYLAKGHAIFVEGSLRTRKWTDKDKVERYSTEIHAHNVKFLNGRAQSEEPQQEEIVY